MTRYVRLLVGLALSWAALQAATLVRLNLDEMIDKSTAIVHARVVSSRTDLRGAIVYTYFAVQVLERWKGPNASQLEVAVPGGTAQGLRQSFSGAPKLVPGQEYVLFLWTGPSGRTQIIGLSQGVFGLQTDAQGEPLATRAPTTEAMLDPKTGRLVTDEAMRMKLSDLRAHVTSRTAAGQAGR